MTTAGALVTQLTQNLDIGLTSPEPTAAEQLGFVITAARSAFGQLQPVFKLVGALDSELALAIPDLATIVLVQAGEDILLDHEYAEGDDELWLRDASLGRQDDPITVWYTKLLDFSSATTETEIDSTCVFGPDWLDDYILLRAEMAASLYQFNTSGAAGAVNFAAQYRSLQQTAVSDQAVLQRVRDQWVQTMRDKKAVALEMVPRFRPGPLRRARNRFRTQNNLVDFA